MKKTSSVSNENEEMEITENKLNEMIETLDSKKPEE